ncbi:MAG: tetratricopeptide repeat protein, partial [Candidatus Nomurabacteria bacterium]|nr:tetratricopeptide repeat protein [Candidatus Nomurabacteria bacterium]
NFIKNKISPPAKGVSLGKGPKCKTLNVLYSERERCTAPVKECPKGEGVKIILIISLLIILIFSCVTIYRNKYYKNKLNFWQNATTTSPSFAFNHSNLGAMYYLDGKIDGAEIEYKKALVLNYYEPMVHNNLGLVYANQGKLKEAEEEYKKEMEVNPGYDNAYFNLGLLYFGEGRYDDATNNWKKTLQINPNYVDALKALTSYYYNQKNYEEAALYAKGLLQMGFELPPDLLKILQLNSF